ncbi:MAG: hypothetical protein K6U74_14875, partial [Firmicutes bacterium]|nr:hypothetical protein [Bacillota bacterium]
MFQGKIVINDYIFYTILDHFEYKLELNKNLLKLKYIYGSIFKNNIYICRMRTSFFQHIRQYEILY